MRQQLRTIGQRAEFIDDWDIYHLGTGEVHCGSNAQRKPFSNRWWETTGGVSP
jgi:protein-arginine deiminase